MKSKTAPVVPEAVTGTEANDTPENAPDQVVVSEKPVDAKEEARRRSKDDLAKKRNKLHKSHGKF